jgi:hypothetical protein
VAKRIDSRVAPGDSSEDRQLELNPYNRLQVKVAQRLARLAGNYIVADAIGYRAREARDASHDTLVLDTVCANVVLRASADMLINCEYSMPKVMSHRLVGERTVSMVNGLHYQEWTKANK